MSCGVLPSRPVVKKRGNRPRIKFDGGGFALCFGLGVSGFLQERYDVVASECDVFGTSIGNISALSLLLNQKPAEIIPKIYKYLDWFLSSTPAMGGCGSLQAVREALWDWLPDNVHELVGGTMLKPSLFFIFLSNTRSFSGL